MPDDLPDRRMPEAIDIYNIIDTWAAAMCPRILQAQVFKGGWEGWAQIELALGIQAKYTEIKVTREQPIYLGTRKRVDILLRADGEDTHAIELKTLSVYAQEQYGNGTFAQGFIDDIDKINDNIVKPGLGNVHLYAIGLCGIQAANQWAYNRLAVGAYRTHISRKELPSKEQPDLWRWGFDYVYVASDKLLGVGDQQLEQFR
jgi:hypothetical protein